MTALLSLGGELVALLAFGVVGLAVALVDWMLR
jgi:hypothetical protein